MQKKTDIIIKLCGRDYAYAAHRYPCLHASARTLPDKGIRAQDHLYLQHETTLHASRILSGNL